MSITFTSFFWGTWFMMNTAQRSVTCRCCYWFHQMVDEVSERFVNWRNNILPHKWHAFMNFWERISIKNPVWLFQFSISHFKIVHHYLAPCGNRNLTNQKYFVVTEIGCQWVKRQKILKVRNHQKLRKFPGDDKKSCIWNLVNKITMPGYAKSYFDLRFIAHASKLSSGSLRLRKFMNLWGSSARGNP